MTLDRAASALNRQAPAERSSSLLSCCHSERWASRVSAAAPYASGEALWASAERAWAEATEADRMEAFAAHPQIGGDLAALRAKYSSSAGQVSVGWSGGEQAGVHGASDAVLSRLSELNLAYAAKFGFIFIVCATGKSAEAMLALLEARLPNSRAEELETAAAEQLKITRLRLEKLAPEAQ